MFFDAPLRASSHLIKALAIRLNQKAVDLV